MPEQEYVTIELRIIRTALGNMTTRKLIAKSSVISEKFKDDLWDDYNIDIDELNKKDQI